MKIILNSYELNNHEVYKYQFKTINFAQGHSAVKKEDILISSVPQEKNVPLSSAPVPEDTVLKKEMNTALHELQQQNESFSESLLKKIDELSTSLVKMEMRLEKQQEEFDGRLDEERQKAFKEGAESGKKEMQASIAQELEAQKRQIVDSIQKMQQTAESFKKVSENIEKELVDAAIDIAKEVLNTQIAENSAKVAHNLATSLIQDVKGAMKVKIKANPADCDYLKANMAADGVIEIIPDNAISKGGIIIESDAGNVDGTVMTRFKAIKRNILEN